MSREKANDRINQQPASNVKRHNGGAIAIAIVSTVVVVALSGVIILLASGKESKVYNTVVTPDNVEEMIAQVDEKSATPIGSYEVIMNTDWVFEDANAISKNAYIKNATTNSNTIYFTIALETDPDHDIYESPLIPVGSYIENISLEGALTEKGTHGAILTYHLVDDKNEEISTVSVSITLTIEK